MVAVLLLITVVIRTSAQEAICSGDDCLQNQSTSSQSGPLGAESACTPKDYPVGAKLSPVSGFRGSFLNSWACLQWKAGKRCPSYQIHLIASACSLRWRLTSMTSVSLEKSKNEIRYGLSLHSMTAYVTWFELTASMTAHVLVQYVFLISERALGRSGRRLWRSTEYGHADTFVDITEKLPGRLPCSTRPCI